MVQCGATCLEIILQHFLKLRVSWGYSRNYRKPFIWSVADELTKITAYSKLSSINRRDVTHFNSRYMLKKRTLSLESERPSNNSLSLVSENLSCALWGSPSLAWCQFQTYGNRQIQQIEDIYTAEILAILKNSIPGHRWLEFECIMPWQKKLIYAA